MELYERWSGVSGFPEDLSSNVSAIVMFSCGRAIDFNCSGVVDRSCLKFEPHAMTEEISSDFSEGAT